MRLVWRRLTACGFALVALGGAGIARAEDATVATAAKPINGADTAFVMIAAALVMLMTPGLGLFYGGMVRRKNVLATFQQSFIMLGVITLQWILFGYSLAFSPGPGALNAFIGGLDWAGLNGVGLTPHETYGPTIPHQLFMVYQLMFAVITPALISGAFAERMKFSAYLAFTLLWATLVYDPVAHWVWGGGWVGKLGALDFAGGLVVHVISGIAALCCVLVMGKRKGLGQEEMHPHNLTMTALGTGLLWFGWFGFNAGSALAANGSAVAAFVNTNTAAATAAFVWCALEWLHKGKGTVLGACTGAVAGLVAVTPAAGYVTPIGALAIGTAVCFACYGAILLKGVLGYDDSLDVFGVHGVGGALGALAVGLLARAGITGDASGLFYGGGFGQLGKQALSLVAAAVYSFVMSFAILKVLDAVIGLRVSTEEEEVGLDLSQHGERGYIMGVGELMGGQPSSGNDHAYASLPPLSELASRSTESRITV
jgi:ammonium transporter, Amt family